MSIYDDHAEFNYSDPMESDYDPFAAMDLAATLNEGRTFANHPSHKFVGIDGRCMDCDCRPFGRHAPLPCILP